MGAKLGCVALFPRLLPHPGKAMLCCLGRGGRTGIDGNMNSMLG